MRKKTARTELLQVKVHPGLKKLIASAAAGADLDIASWIRSSLAEKLGWNEKLEQEIKRQEALAAMSTDDDSAF
jgi:hypothetical protein